MLLRTITPILVIGGMAAAMLPATIPTAANAQKVKPNCGMTGTTTASLGNYDPFNSVGLSSIPATLALTRLNESGGGTTQNATLYFTMPSGSPNYQILYNGVNVLYPAPYTTAPTITSGSSPTGAIYLWGSAADPDTINLPVTITIPSGVDLTAGLNVNFGVRYVCKGTGQMQSVESPIETSGAITLLLQVLSALQASYVGSALSFGEVGTTTTASLVGTPKTASGNVRVASSGPYTVNVKSANGYKLKATGADTINYQTEFLGQTRSNAATSDINANCQRAGVTGELLPIKTTLKEGGIGKAPHPNYNDTLTVTVTPKVTLGGTSDCSALTPP